MQRKEIFKRLRTIAKNDGLSIEDVEEVGRLLDELYPKISLLDEFREGAEIVYGLYIKAYTANIPIFVSASALYSGWFISYHYWLKMLPRDIEGKIIKPIAGSIIEKIDEFEIVVNGIYQNLNRAETPRRWIKYGLLLSLIKSQLQFNVTEAKEIEKAIKPEIEEFGDEALKIKDINTRGLAELSANNFEKAIEIFLQAQKQFSYATNIPHCRQDFAHTLNNAALSGIKWSDSKEGEDQILELRRDFMFLENALWIYKEVPLVFPVNHVKGIINRFIMVAIKTLNYYGHTEEGNAVQKAFGEKQISEAISKMEKVTGINEIHLILEKIDMAQKIIASQNK